MDKSAVAPVIYGTHSHQTTDRGVVVPVEIREELKRFLCMFNTLVGICQTPYYRLDVYFDDSSLWVLELNASFVDGWGTALNLARASGVRIDPKKLIFPKKFACKDHTYLPELQLVVTELADLGDAGHTLCDADDNTLDPVYVYGRVGSPDQVNIRPYDGVRLDDKRNLGLHSRQWFSETVKTPRHYLHRFDPWEGVPKDVALKFCDKGSPECDRAGRSVILRKPSGKAPFLKRCYGAEKMIAQDIVQPFTDNGYNCQLIILAIGDEPITGYVQYSRSDIINDNSVHGPLWIQ